MVLHTDNTQSVSEHYLSVSHLLREKNTPDLRASSFSQAAFLLMVILVSSRMVILSVTPVVVALAQEDTV